MTKSTKTSDRAFRTMREFETAMFPRMVEERAAACEHEHPQEAGTRLAEEALARLSPDGEIATRAGGTNR
jgi:hypothetical protein